MNKQAIQDRITKLEADREQLKAMIIATEGAIQDCRHWLQQVETPAVTNTEEADG